MWKFAAQRDLDERGGAGSARPPPPDPLLRAGSYLRFREGRQAQGPWLHHLPPLEAGHPVVDRGQGERLTRVALSHFVGVAESGRRLVCLVRAAAGCRRRRRRRHGSTWYWKRELAVGYRPFISSPSRIISDCSGRAGCSPGCPWRATPMRRGGRQLGRLARAACSASRSADGRVRG